MVTNKIISIDIGGTNIRIATFEYASSTPLKIVKKVLAEEPKKNFELIEKAVEETKPTHIAFGIAGTVEEGVIYTRKDKLYSFNNFKPSAYFPRSFVITKGDTYFATLGESRYGNIFDKDFLYLNWGTGIGAGYIDKEKRVSEIPWKKHFETIEKELKIVPLGTLSESDWQKPIDLLLSHALFILQSYSCTNIILGGGVVVNNKERFNRYIVEKNLQKTIYISTLGDNQGILGGYVACIDEIGGDRV